MKGARASQVGGVTRSSLPVKPVRQSNAGGFRASNALQSIQAFQSQAQGAQVRASVSLGSALGGDGELRIENERLKTTLMILNQKMKTQEDNEDLQDKWKAQCAQKESQVQQLNGEIHQLKATNEMQRVKIKGHNKEKAAVEADLLNA
jgi:hypothetical protein